MTHADPHDNLPAERTAEEAELWARLTVETAARVNAHADHDWIKHGRCFYCHDCDVRVGQEPLIASGVKEGLITHPRFALAGGAGPAPGTVSPFRRPTPPPLQSLGRVPRQQR